jgi:uncharacterized protein
MLCPICQIELMMADRQGIEIDYCPKCRGIWLDRGELDKLVQHSHQRETYKLPIASRLEDDYDDVGYTPHEPYDNRGSLRKKKSFLSNIFDVFD